MCKVAKYAELDTADRSRREAVTLSLLLYYYITGSLLGYTNGG